MNGGDIVARMRALATVAPFSALTGHELLLIAEQIRPYHFASDTVLLAAGDVADRLYVVVGGSAMAGKGPAPVLFDAPSVLFSLPVEQEYRAGADGLEALCLARPHLFTIARECPDFIAALVDLRRIVA